MVKWWLMILDNLQGTNAMHFMHLMHRTLVFQSVFTTRVVQGAGSQLVGLTAATRLGAGGWRWGDEMNCLHSYITYFHIQIYSIFI